MRVPRLAIAFLALGATLVASGPAGALSLPPATALALPTPNYGLDQGYLPFQSCSSLGNCAVAGMYLNAQSVDAGVIDDEVKGVWQTPVTLAIPLGGDSSKSVTMSGVSCPANNACVAVGQYVTAIKNKTVTIVNEQAFVATQVNGVWQRAVALTLPTNAMSSSEVATPHAITCVSAGNCSVVGTYTTDTAVFATEGFMANEVKGVWRPAVELALPRGSNANPFVSLSQVACWSGANCTAVGSYLDSNNVAHALVVPEVSGTWKRGLSMSLPANASAFAGASFNEVTCTATGSCLALGNFNTVSGAVQPLVALSANGLWSSALQVRLPHAASNPQALSFGFDGVACASAGNCAFGGQYLDVNGHYQGFLDAVVNGFVQPARVLALPSGAIQAGHNGGVVSLSCPAVGDCVAGAAFLNAAKHYEGLVVSESNGVWAPGHVIALPGGATTVGVGGGVYSAQCFTTTTCQLTGSYLATATRYEGFTLLTSA